MTSTNTAKESETPRSARRRCGIRSRCRSTVWSGRRSGGFSGGLLTMRDIPVGGSDEIVATYEGDLELTEPAVDSKRAN